MKVTTLMIVACVMAEALDESNLLQVNKNTPYPTTTTRECPKHQEWKGNWGANTAHPCKDARCENLLREPDLCEMQIDESGCFCKEGYVKNKNDKCVRKSGSMCRQEACRAKGEILMEVGSCCEPTCEKPKQVCIESQDTPDHLKCKENNVCQCSSGKVRRADGKCVSKRQCKRFQWVKGLNGQHCGTVCSQINMTCDSAASSALTTNEKVSAAFQSAGYSCKGFHGARGYDGAPFSTGRADDCAPFSPGLADANKQQTHGDHWKGTSSCSANKQQTHAALCSCKKASP